MNRRELPPAMLLATANWAVSDGSLAGSRAGRAVAWLGAIRRAVVRAGWDRTGQYHPVAEVTLVFAGDTFDWLLSAAWADRHKPWHAGREADDLRARVARGTLRAAWPAARTLLRWGRQGLAVPAADGRGRPAPWGAVPARVCVALLSGDRDRWLPTLAASEGRGLHVGEEWSDGRTHIRHGHDLDPLTHVDHRLRSDRERAPTLGESLAVDLVVPFAIAAREDAELWPRVRPLLGPLAAARPAAMPTILAEIAAGGAGGLPGRLAALWRKRVAGWHQVARRDAVACEAEFEVLDAVAAWLEQLRPEGGCPPAVARLDLPSPAVPGRPGVVVAHLPLPSGPVLDCSLAGRSWSEPLEPPPSGRGIVTIGAGDGGGGFVDAA